MFRYLGFIWDVGSTEAREAIWEMERLLHGSSHTWSCGLREAGAAVFHTGARKSSSEAYRCEGQPTLVLGKLFEQYRGDGNAPPSARIDGIAASEIVRSSARQLIQRYWGRYVAFTHDRGIGTTRVLRDPTGCLPCYFTTHRSVRIVFGYPEDCRSVGVPPFSVNWRFVSAFLAYRALQLRDTGLAEVAEVQPGECVAFSRSGCTHELYWRPLEVASSSLIEDPVQAVSELRAVTRACVHAWASCYSSIIHTLSGGLDSSIVALCLSAAPHRPSVACLNYHTLGSEGDERRYARLSAQKAGFELVEHRSDPTTVDLRGVLDVSHPPRPWVYTYYLEHSRFEAQLAREKGAEAIFTGAGGDQVFYQSRAVVGVNDYVELHGVRPGLIRVAWDAARMDSRSLWSILREALMESRSRAADPTFKAVRETKTLLSDNVLAIDGTSEDLRSAWLSGPESVPSGKREHIRIMCVPPAFYDPLLPGAFPERTFPLLSQPLIELCLRIPSHVLTTGGWDRAIARRAFSSDVPREVIRRRHKGRVNNHLKHMIQSNVEFIRELLLDGMLVRNQMLDRPKLEEVLLDESAVAASAFEELEDYISTEAWLRHWTARHPRSATDDTRAKPVAAAVA